jgi:predicted porin
MKLKSLVQVLALALVANAAWAQSSVTISGGVDVGIQRINDTTKMETAGSTRSNLTFTSIEDLGDGMQAMALLNIRFRPDDGQLNPGAVNIPGTTQLFRHSFVQLGSKNYGVIRLGRYLSPLQEVNGAFDVWGTDTVATPHTGGINSGSRYNNQIELRSPNFGGLQVIAAYATREDNVNGAAAGTLAPEAPKGLAVRYTNGPVDASLAWDRNGSGLKTIGAYGSYDFSVARLYAQYEKGDATPGVAIVNGIGVTPLKAGITSVSRYSVTASVPQGSWVLKGGYGYYPDEQVKKLGLGADYFFSKRTNLYMDAAKLSGDNAGLTDANRQARFDVGLWHRF